VKTYTVGDDVGVTVKRAFWVAVRGLVSGEVPDDQGLVAGSGEQHVGAVKCQSFDLQVPSALQTYFSMDVAKEVTQPLWPSRVPFRINCSVMLGNRLKRLIMLLEE
jgi:hypothetical protein